MLNPVSKFYGGLRLARNPKPVCKITINFIKTQTSFENRKTFVYGRGNLSFLVFRFFKI